MHAMKCVGVGVEDVPTCLACYSLHDLMCVTLSDEKFQDRVPHTRLETIMEHAPLASNEEAVQIQKKLMTRLLVEQFRHDVGNKEPDVLVVRKLVAITNSVLEMAITGNKLLLKSVATVFNNEAHTNVDVIEAVSSRNHNVCTMCVVRV